MVMENVDESVGNDAEVIGHCALYTSMLRAMCNDCKTAFVIFVVHLVGQDWRDDQVVDWNVRSDGGNGDDNDGELPCRCE